MHQEILLTGKKITLKPLTNELWHDFYINYVVDLIMDTTPYVYNREQLEKAYLIRISDSTRLYLAIMHEAKVIGTIYLKHMDKATKQAEFGIALVDDSVKGKGYGTEAIMLLINYAFDELGLRTIIADSVLRNTRSHHVLEKIGFQYTHEDSAFKYFKLETDRD